MCESVKHINKDKQTIMKPFHYNQDPLYAIASEFLADQNNKENVTLEEAFGLGLHDNPKIALGDATVKQLQASKEWYTTTIDKWKKNNRILPVSVAKDTADKLANIKKELASRIGVKEDVSIEDVSIEEGVEDIAAAVKALKKGDKTNFGVVVDVGQHSISFKAKDLPITKIAFNQRKMGSKDFVLDKLVKLKEDVSLEEDVELEEAVKANDPANLRSIISNHTNLLNKATDSKAKEIHRVAIANAKEKLKSLGEDVELEEAYKVGFPLAKKAIKAVTDLDPDEFKEFLGGMADYFYDVAARDNGEPGFSRSYIVKTAVHFEQAYKGWKTHE